MKNEALMRKFFVDNTIRLIAEGGFENATTRAITTSGNPPSGLKPNEAYIYRLFGSKENLYAECFKELDRELSDSFYSAISIIGDLSTDVEARLREIFRMAWSFTLGNEARCRCYVRFYYSIYFKDESIENHRRCFEGLISGITPLFKKEADVYSVLHSVFVTLLDFSIRVYNGDLEDNEDTRTHIFNVLYRIMSAYFRKAA